MEPITKSEKRVIPTLKDMKQVYDQYTAEDQQVWSILYDRQIVNMPGAATVEFMKGLDVVKFTNKNIPAFEETNVLLREATGWELVAVEGIVDDKLFFELMSNKKFPATTWLRKMEELDYLEEPDMFHDVFAHVPLLTNQAFVDYLQALSEIGAAHANDPEAIELLSRIYWFTVEFGLIKEPAGLRIYGAGILSSVGETRFSLSDEPEHFAYDVAQILDTPFRKDTFQEKYFIIESYEQLFHSIDEVKMRLNEKLQSKVV
ncbi:phenylalanine 4-monooxygenase [Fulvivirga sediminis]|uniref:Phenylalanine 4-monooxygenase n=1 Tax=Fulvivirga sediminis TaxID=2803949 RepID=A0A937FD24_9BACT|nr:phenylalanine 4-monooxygenase [Fulvivirga sediminis]MBL3658680.1 phenylalanine 4-monooxygenase [Fulvivirga sediminis]